MLFTWNQLFSLLVSQGAKDAHVIVANVGYGLPLLRYGGVIHARNDGMFELVPH